MMKIKGNCLVVNKKQHIVAAPQGSGLHGEQKKKSHRRPTTGWSGGKPFPPDQPEAGDPAF